MRSTRALIVLASLAFMWACAGRDSTNPVGAPIEMSAVADAYLTTVLDTMQRRSVRRHEIDWPSFRHTTRTLAEGARTTRDTYVAIRDAVDRLGDRHSRFLAPEEVGADIAGEGVRIGRSVSPGAPRSAVPTGRRLTPEIAFVDVQTFNSLGRPLAVVTEHVDQYHALLAALDSPLICGWVVDLRFNAGGSMWPMLAGIGPILGPGVAGFFVDPDGETTTWFYQDGGAGLIEVGVFARGTGSYELLTPHPPVAVLTGPNTASAGEAVATAFRGRSDTRSFGTGTFGVSTANRGFFQSDGALLLLSATTFADRTGTLYGGVLEPDSTVAGLATQIPESDLTLAVAMDWLRDHPACAP